MLARLAGPRAIGPTTLGLFTALLLIPSANSHAFDGLPLGSLPEFAVLVMVVPLWVSRGLRHGSGRLLARLGPIGRGVLLATLLLALGAKLLLLASGTHEGFLACYRSPLRAPPAGPCERSYENAAFRWAVTRVDRRLDFGPRGWDLSFVNSLRFDFYPWIPGNVRRDRLPLLVTWRGTVERGAPWVARITYVGQAQIRIGAAEIELPAHYGSPVTVDWTVPAGRLDVGVRYAFDDGSRIGGPRPGPYATFQLGERRTNGGTRLVRPARPALGWRVVGRAVDAAILAGAATALALYAWLLRREWWGLGFVALGSLVVGWRPIAGVVGEAGGFLLLGVLLWRVLAVPRARGLLGAYFAVAYLAALDAKRRFGQLTVVEPRSAGDDWLTYESLARSILETGSLAGGEAVFYYQPLFRYLRFAEHLLLGDGDPLVFAAVRGLLLWALLWLAARLWRGRWWSTGGRVLFVGAAVLLLTVANSVTVAGFLRVGASETHTWILLPLAVPLLFVARRPRGWRLGTALLGLSLITRTNQAPALLWMLLVFARRAAGREPRRALAAVGLFAAIALLPLVHNLAFGHQFVPLTTSAGVPENLGLAPARWLAIGNDPAVRDLAWRQVTGIFFLSRDLLRDIEPRLPVVMYGLLFAWGLAAAWSIARGQLSDGSARGLLLLPALYLGVYLVYDAAVYYPRHLVAGYLAMGAVAMLAAREAGQRGRRKGVAATRAWEASGMPSQARGREVETRSRRLTPPRRGG